MAAVQDNIDVAILAKVNDLAERYGFKPYELVASMSHGEALDQHCLTFETVPEATRHPDRMAKLLAAVGVDSNNCLIGTDAAIYEALQNALHRSPYPRHIGDGGRFSSN